MSFYERPEWQRLRFKILKKYGFKCMACNRSGNDRAVIQVDHIKPISIYPELALTESNLQVLCRECNMGKSNVYSDDLRPKSASAAAAHMSPSEMLIRQNLSSAASKEAEQELMRLFLDLQKEKHGVTK